MLNILFRSLALILVFIRWFYWKKEEKRADREKEKTITHYTLYHKISKSAFYLFDTIILLQVCGLPLVQILHPASYIQPIGLAFILLGIGISILARKELQANWANGYEYQIKKHHELITSGIYAYIRHPIYAGMILSYIGLELVAQSYLWISVLGLFVAAYSQGRREEKILLVNFGNAYQEYLKKSKMLIPFIL